MSSWWEGPMVGFDLETTSPDPETARIVTAALVVIDGGVLVEHRDWLADPGVVIPEEAAAIHGVTTERARAEGCPIADVVADVANALRDRPAGAPLVAFNARYDLTVLDRELRRHLGVSLPVALAPTAGVAYLNVIDPLVIDKWLDRFRPGSRKLDAICAHYRARLDDAHEAHADALAAVRCAYAIGLRGDVVRSIRQWKRWEDRRELEQLREQWETVRYDLGLLHAAQERWAYDQAVGLAQHFREAGKPGADDVRTEWPLIPATVAA
jgi:DNA polymerase-3 subunit epsilon